MTRALLVLAVLGLPAFQAARAQDLADRFKQARILRVAQETASRYGLRMEPRPLADLPTRGDTLAAWMASLHTEQEHEPEPEPAPDPFQVDSIRVFSRLERVVFSNRYGQTKWAFLQGRRLSEMDTTMTADIRARLEAHFGPPTFTLAEMDSVRGRMAEEIIQFEYWMVVNDSIPIMLIDVNGPLSRGVVVASDARFRPNLDAVRHALLGPLFSEPRRAPFVDYFYQVDSAAWYATGFDGATFFHRRIDRPNLTLGRPRLSEYVSDGTSR